MGDDAARWCCSLKAIHNTTQISEVFLGGKEFDRAALTRLPLWSGRWVRGILDEE
jgi:hypothetical protein